MFDKNIIVGVIGAGTMGNGIAQALAEKGGFNVVMIDALMDLATNGHSQIKNRLNKLVIKGQIVPTQRDEILSRITVSTDYDSVANSQIVIEAVTEKLEIKRGVLSKLGEICSENTIIASNTSTISIGRLAEISGRPEKFAGMHWMNPVQVMPVIELIKAEKTSDETWNYIKALAAECGKDHVEAADKTGFIANTVLFGLLRAAMFAFENVNGTRDYIGKMMVGLNQPICPLALCDMIGLDVCLDILNSLHEAYKDVPGMAEFYKPPEILINFVAAKKLGCKSGEGFYTY